MAGAGAGGMAGAGAGGMAGAGAGGMAGAGAGGMAGAGAGGMAGAGAGGAGAGGMAGAGGGGGQGGMLPAALYDFENGVQGWSTTSVGTTVSASPDQEFGGAQSLRIAHLGLDNANLAVSVNAPPVWPGTVLTFHAFFPVGFDTSGGTYFQAFAQANNYKIGFETAGNSARTAVPGGWATWTYTVPNTFPGGLQVLGFQVGDNSGGTTVAAGDIFIDEIVATGGTQNCAVATGVGAHGFETGPLDANLYGIDNSATDVVITQSTEQANSGTGSMKVAFTALPAPSSGQTERRVFVSGPDIYCGQMATVRVFLPTGSEGLTFQVYAHYNNFSQRVPMGPSTAMTNAWNTFSFTVPSNVGPGGIQRLGVQFNYTGGTAFTGSAYIDDITW
jgi:hypothetical protein